MINGLQVLDFKPRNGKVPQKMHFENRDQVFRGKGGY
jgi:hypothetical protein